MRRGSNRAYPGGNRRPLWLLALAASLVTFALVAGAAPASGAVTIGQVGTPPPFACAGPSPALDAVQPTVTSGLSYVVPANGRVEAWTLTSWSTNASAGLGSMGLKVFRPVSGSTYRAVGHDGPRSITDSVLNTFSGLSIPVRPGDVLGLHVPPLSNSPVVGVPCVFETAGESGLLGRFGNLADGGAADFPEVASDSRLNITAVVEPTNAFTLGKAKLNRKRGTATLAAKLPNPGRLVLTGRGLKKRSKAVARPGRSSLKLKPAGRAKRKLERTGRARVKATVRYRPTGGAPRSKSKRVRLRKH